MKEFKIKEHIWSIVGISVGVIAIAAGFGIYFGLSASTPNYLLIKNNSFVGDLDDYDSNNKINDKKYYLLSDNLFEISETGKNETTITFDLTNFMNENSSFDNFKLNINYEIEASKQDIEGNAFFPDNYFVGTDLDYINNEGRLVSIKRINYSTFPSTSISESFTFSREDDFSTLMIRVEGYLVDAWHNYLTDIEINEDSFYISALGVEI